MYQYILKLIQICTDINVWYHVILCDVSLVHIVALINRPQEMTTIWLNFTMNHSNHSKAASVLCKYQEEVLQCLPTIQLIKYLKNKSQHKMLVARNTMQQSTLQQIHARWEKMPINYSVCSWQSATIGHWQRGLLTFKTKWKQNYTFSCAAQKQYLHALCNPITWWGNVRWLR